MSACTHFAGIPIFVHGRLIRQRCGWCGAVLVDVDLNGTTIKPPAPGLLPVGVQLYEPGVLVRLFDDLPSFDPTKLSGLVLPDTRIPDDCCGMLPREVTR